MKKQLWKHFSLGLLLLTLCYSCKDISTPKNDNTVSIIRYDKLQNDFVNFNSFASLHKMKTKYTQETKLLYEDVLNLGAVNNQDIDRLLKEHFSKPVYQKLMKDAIEKYDNMEEIEKEITASFHLLKKAIPRIEIPTIYAQVSGLNESVVIGNKILGFSIDKYMGENYSLYQYHYYDYQRHTMSKDFIVPDCLFYFLISEMPLYENAKNHNCLEVLTYYGKIYYIMHAIDKKKSIEDFLGYSKQERKWCKENVKKIWTYMSNKNHLKATDPYIIRSYCKLAPFTNFFGEASPSRIGMWIGYQLVDSYMKAHKEVTLKDLFENTNYQEIAVSAHFKP